MKNKKIIVVICILLVAIFLWQQFMSKKYSIYQDYSYTTTPQSEQTIQNAINVTQTIVSKKQYSDNKSVSIEKGKTALDLLQKTEKVTMHGEGINAFVEGINDEQTSMKEKTFWAFYVNGKQANIGAGGYVLQDEDKIEWKLETY